MQAWTSAATSEAGAADAIPADAAAAPVPVLLPGHRLPGLACTLPGALMAWRTLQGSAGADPLAALVHGTGWWALALLLATLAAGALRRLVLRAARGLALHFGRRGADWNPLVRLRRQLGLWGLAYALAHVLLYAVLEAGSWRELLADLGDRPFLLVGAAALALLLPLGATSNRHAHAWLGPHWATLHRALYLAVALALGHDWMQTKLGHAGPLAATLVFGLLLLLRWRAWRRGDRQPTRPVPERR